MDAQGADGVEHGEDHHADVGEDSGPHVRDTGGRQGKAGKFHDEGEHDVLPHDADALARDADGLGDLQGIVVHQHNVRGFDGGVAAHGAHGDADVRAGQDGRVVDAVADKGEIVLRGLFCQQLFDLGDLVARQKLAADLVDAQLARDLLGYAARVAREHDGLGDTGLLEAGNGLGGVRLDDIGDDDVPGVDAVDGHVDDRADAVAVVVFDAELLHELGIACGDAVAVNGRRDAVAADLLDIRNTAAVDRLSIGLLQAPADGMRRGAFCQRGIFQHFIGVQLVMMDGRDLKHALRQGAGLVKHDDLRCGKGLQIV